jgi:urate oxidase
MAEILFNTYGKTRVRLTTVQRHGNLHGLKEVTVDILLEGDLEDSFTKADNTIVLPTDTMKNTVYVVARTKPIVSIEQFARDLGKHFLDRLKHIEKVKIRIEETPWSRIEGAGTAFVQASGERRTVSYAGSRSGEEITAGIHNLQIMKTAQSGFAGFMRDEYTTLADTNDRLLGTVLEADWRYSRSEIDWDSLYTRVRAVLLDLFAKHDSLSVQQTLFDMAAGVMEAIVEVTEVHLTMPNKHCLLADLSKFGLDNPNEIFVPIDEPSGYIEARVSR